MNAHDKLIIDLLTLDTSDPERCHSKADALILDFLPEEVRQAYDRIASRCSWWASA